MAEELVLFLTEIILYLLPFYIANSSAMLFGSGKALDLGIKLRDGERLFGKGKTILGTVAGIFFGTLSAVVVNYFIAVPFTQNYVLLGFLVSLGAVIGDIAGSFVKRRNKIPSGHPMPFLDQLDFLVGGMLFGASIYIPSLTGIIFAIIFTIVLHRLTNWIAFKLKLKKVPW